MEGGGLPPWPQKAHCHILRTYPKVYTVITGSFYIAFHLRFGTPLKPHPYQSFEPDSSRINYSTHTHTHTHTHEPTRNLFSLSYIVRSREAVEQLALLLRTRKSRVRFSGLTCSFSVLSGKFREDTFKRDQEMRFPLLICCEKIRRKENPVISCNQIRRCST
jgi:hypothetical protein